MKQLWQCLVCAKVYAVAMSVPKVSVTHQCKKLGVNQYALCRPIGLEIGPHETAQLQKDFEVVEEE